MQQLIVYPATHYVLVISKRLQAEIGVDLHVELKRVKEELLLRRSAGSVGAETVGGSVEETNEIHWRAVIPWPADALLLLPMGSEHWEATKQRISLMEHQQNTMSDALHSQVAGHRYPYLFSPARYAQRATHLSCRLCENVAKFKIWVYMKPNRPWIIIIIDQSESMLIDSSLLVKVCFVAKGMAGSHNCITCLCLRFNSIILPFDY